MAFHSVFIVLTLQSYGQALKQEDCFSGVLGDDCGARGIARGGLGGLGPPREQRKKRSVSCRSTKYGCVHSKTFKYFCVYTKRSASRGGRGGVYGEPATVSDMPHQAPLHAISGYAHVWCVCQSPELAQ